MPELPEVETVCRGLGPVLEKQRIEGVILRRPNLRYPFQKDFIRLLQGAVVEKVERRAKYILIHLQTGMTWVTHLGMSGRMILGAKEALNPHDHVTIKLSSKDEIRYRDPRRFGYMVIVKRDTLKGHPYFKSLGPEPLSAEFTPKTLEASLALRKGSIKTVLLNQHVVAGLGNIYVCEALFEAGIDPRRASHTLDETQVKRLHSAIQRILKCAIAAGGSTLQDHRHVTGELGYFQYQFSVYDREGKKCKKCNLQFQIDRINQGGRSTFFCSHCQK